MSSIDSAFGEGSSDTKYPELEAVVALAYWCSYVLDKPTPGMAVFQLALQKNNPLDIFTSAPIQSDIKEGSAKIGAAYQKEKYRTFLFW